MVRGFNVEPNTYIFFCYFFELLKKSELAGMCGVTFVGTTYRRVPKLRHEVECCMRTFCLYFFIWVLKYIDILYMVYSKGFSGLVNIVL